MFSKNPQQTEKSLTPSMAANLITLANEKDFAHLLKKSGKKWVVVEFFAKWCGPCQKLTTKLEQLAQAYDGRITIVKIDVDEFEKLTAEFDISAIPTFIIMKNKTKVMQFFSSDVQTLEKNLEKYAGAPKKLTKEKQK